MISRTRVGVSPRPCAIADTNWVSMESSREFAISRLGSDMDRSASDSTALL
jgi:hypothetical protein